MRTHHVATVSLDDLTPSGFECVGEGLARRSRGPEFDASRPRDFYLPPRGDRVGAGGGRMEYRASRAAVPPTFFRPRLPSNLYNIALRLLYILWIRTYI